MRSSAIRFGAFWTFVVLWLCAFGFYLVFRAGDEAHYFPFIILGVAAASSGALVLAFGVAAHDLRLREMIDRFLGFLDRQPIVFLFLVLVLAIIFTLWTFFTGAELEYKAHYLVQWKGFLNGNNPWEPAWEYPPLALGPLHVVFAPLAALAALLPKFIFVLSFFAAIVVITRQIIRQETDILVPFVVFCALVPFGPYFWSVVAHLGFIDGFVAVLCVLAFWLRDKDRLAWAGGVLGVAACMSFYPLFLLPFLMIGSDSLRLKPLAVGAAVVAAAYGAGYFVWGDYVFLAFDGAQPAKWLSVFRALDGVEGWSATASAIPGLSLVLMMCATGFVFLFCYLRQVPPTLGAALGLLAVLLFCRVGHVQFYAAYILLMSLALAHWSDRSVRAVIVVSLPFILFLSGFMVWYDLTLRFGDMALFTDGIRETVGLIAFPLGLATLVASCMLAGDGLRDPLFRVRWAKYVAAPIVDDTPGFDDYAVFAAADVDDDMDTVSFPSAEN